MYDALKTQDLKYITIEALGSSPFEFSFTPFIFEYGVIYEYVYQCRRNSSKDNWCIWESYCKRNHTPEINEIPIKWLNWCRDNNGTYFFSIDEIYNFMVLFF